MRGDVKADGMNGIVGWHRTEWFGAFVGSGCFLDCGVGFWLESLR